MKPLAAALLGSSRSAILGTLLLRPEREVHVRELSRVTGVGVGNLQRELRSLLGMGLVTRREVGRQVFYAADARSPVFKELAGFMRKTSGLADTVREALTPAAERIQASFIYGSMAAGSEGPHSDVDVMIIGELTFADATRALHGAQALVGREINPTVMTAREFATRKRSRDGFIQAVIREPKIWLIGDERDLAELGKTRPAARV